MPARASPPGSPRPPRDRLQLEALGQAVASWEREFGALTDTEIARRDPWDRGGSVSPKCGPHLLLDGCDASAEQRRAH
jgi:hypothetical protein